MVFLVEMDREDMSFEGCFLNELLATLGADRLVDSFVWYAPRCCT